MNTKTITLDKEHPLGGKLHPVGTELTLHEKLVDWLVAQKIGHETQNGAPVQRTSHRSFCCGRSR